MKVELVQELLEARFWDFTPPVLQVIDGAVSAGLEPSDEEVCRKVLDAIAVHNSSSFRGSHPPSLTQMSQLIDAALEYESELASLDLVALKERYRELMQRRKQARDKKAAALDERVYDHPRYDADFELWNKKGAWTVEQAVALSMGKDPSRVGATTFSKSDSLIRREFVNRRNALCVLENLEPQTSKPIAFFVEWFENQQLETPELFGLSRARESQNLAETLRLKEDIINELREELQKTKDQLEIAQKKAARPDRTLTMEKLIYCLAVKKFQYKPREYGHAIKGIENCCKEVSVAEGNEGLAVANNTIRVLLREVAEEWC